MAAFVTAFGWRPCDYYALTWAERSAIIDAARTAHNTR